MDTKTDLSECNEEKNRVAFLCSSNKDSSFTETEYSECEVQVNTESLELVRRSEDDVNSLRFRDYDESLPGCLKTSTNIKDEKLSDKTYSKSDRSKMLCSSDNTDNSSECSSTALDLAQMNTRQLSEFSCVIKDIIGELQDSTDIVSGDKTHEIILSERIGQNPKRDVDSFFESLKTSYSEDLEDDLDNSKLSDNAKNEKRLKYLVELENTFKNNDSKKAFPGDQNLNYTKPECESTLCENNATSFYDDSIGFELDKKLHDDSEDSETPVNSDDSDTPVDSDSSDDAKIPNVVSGNHKSGSSPSNKPKSPGSSNANVSKNINSSHAGDVKSNPNNHTESIEISDTEGNQITDPQSIQEFDPEGIRNSNRRSHESCDTESPKGDDPKSPVDCVSESPDNSYTESLKSSNPENLESSEPESREGSDPQSAEGSDSQSAEGSDSQSAEGSDSQSAEGSDSQSTEGSDTQSAEGSDSQSAEGSDSESVESCDTESTQISDRVSPESKDQKSPEKNDPESPLGKNRDMMDRIEICSNRMLEKSRHLENKSEFKKSSDIAGTSMMLQIKTKWATRLKKVETVVSLNEKSILRFPSQNAIEAVANSENVELMADNENTEIIHNLNWESANESNEDSFFPRGKRVDTSSENMSECEFSHDDVEPDHKLLNWSNKFTTENSKKSFETECKMQDGNNTLVDHQQSCVDSQSNLIIVEDVDDLNQETKSENKCMVRKCSFEVFNVFREIYHSLFRNLQSYVNSFINNTKRKIWSDGIVSDTEENKSITSYGTESVSSCADNDEELGNNEELSTDSDEELDTENEEDLNKLKTFRFPSFSLRGITNFHTLFLHLRATAGTYITADQVKDNIDGEILLQLYNGFQTIRSNECSSLNSIEKIIKDNLVTCQNITLRSHDICSRIRVLLPKQARTKEELGILNQDLKILAGEVVEHLGKIVNLLANLKNSTENYKESNEFIAEDLSSFLMNDFNCIFK